MKPLLLMFKINEGDIILRNGKVVEKNEYNQYCLVEEHYEENGHRVYVLGRNTKMTSLFIPMKYGASPEECISKLFWEA